MNFLISKKLKAQKCTWLEPSVFFNLLESQRPMPFYLCLNFSDPGGPRKYLMSMCYIQVLLHINDQGLNKTPIVFI